MSAAPVQPHPVVRAACAARGALRVAAVIALAAAARPAGAQADLPARGAALATRVAAVRDGLVRFAFPLRAGVCGIGESVRVGRDQRTIVGNWYGGDFEGSTLRGRDVEWEKECETGPGRVVLDVSGGSVQQVRFYVGGRWRPADARVVDLGDVPADQASGLLLRIAQRDGLQAEPRAARSAIFPATLGADVAPWPSLLRLARDPAQSKEARSQAMHWLGVGAGETATAGLAELSTDPNQEVRLAAVSALSRQPAAQGVPVLLNIARTHKDPAMRRQAMFWLGRSDDPRALALFEELLAARR
jgi:hypothetical protein